MPKKWKSQNIHINEVLLGLKKLPICFCVNFCHIFCLHDILCCQPFGFTICWLLGSLLGPSQLLVEKTSNFLHDAHHLQCLPVFMTWKYITKYFLDILGLSWIITLYTGHVVQQRRIVDSKSSFQTIGWVTIGFKVSHNPSGEASLSRKWKSLN